MQQNISLMELISRDFIEANGICGITKGNKFFSRKNDVFEVEITFKGNEKKLFVLKEYKGPQKKSKIKNELFYYYILKNTALKIPSIYYTGSDFIIMEYLGKKTLLDFIISREEEFKKMRSVFDDGYEFKKDLVLLVDSLKWVFDFNKYMVKKTGKSFILKDLNLRNFIIKNNMVFRVDFEDCARGKPEEDFAKFIAFFLTYDPPFTDWKKAVSEAIKRICEDEMRLKTDMLESYIENEFEEMKRRRKHKGNL